MASEKLLKDVKAEVKIRSSDQKKQEIVMNSTACYPHDVSIIPWCNLITQDKSPPSDQSTPYFQLYRLSHSKEQTITSLCLQYRGSVNMKVLLVITTINQQQLDTIMTSDPALKDLTFSIVIIPKTYSENISSLFTGANYVEATVASLIIGKRSEVGEAFFPNKSLSSELLIKTTQHILQERICVSLADGTCTAGVYPPNKRLISSFLESVYMLKTEETLEFVSFDWIKILMELLSQDVHIKAVFVKDFVFFFNLAYAEFRNLTGSIAVRTNSFYSFLHHCISKLLRTPVESIMESLVCFIERGDCFFDRGGLLGATGIFEHTGKSLIQLCQPCFQITKNINAIFLLVSIGIKVYNCCNMLKKTVNLWQKHLIEHYKSTGFTIEDVTSLNNGLHSMSVILAGHPQLMITWKEFLSVLVSVVHSFVFLNKFISIGVTYLTKNNNDTSFRIDFLQPLTEKYLTASDNKKARNNFSLDNKTLVDDGTAFISFLILLIEDHHWCVDDYTIMLEKWVAIVMNLVDLSNYDNTVQLIRWIDKGHEMYEMISFRSYQKVFNVQLELKLIHQSENLAIESFIEIINKSDINKPKVVIEFLSRSHITTTIATEPLRSLIVLSSNILSSTSNSDYVIEFISYLKNVMERYSRSNQSLQFILDLMSLDLHLDGLFDATFLGLINSSIASPNVQHQLIENLPTLFHYVPLTENSFNLLILKTIIEISFPNWTNIDTVIESLSTVFNHSELIPEHFSTVRFECALELFLQLEKDVSYDNFTSSNIQLVIAFSKSIQNIWKAFTNSYKDEDMIHTIESFHEATKYISGFSKLVRVVCERFKPFLNGIKDLVKKKDVTYSKMENLLTNYSVYEAMYSCVSEIYKDFSNAVTKQELKVLRICYDEQVKKIQDTLVNLQHGLPCHVKSVLSMYGIEFPEDLDRELNQVVTASSKACEDSNSSIESYIVLIYYHPQPNTTIAHLESFVEHLSSFMKPLSLTKAIDVLAVSSLYPSVLLSKCIEYYQQLQLDSTTAETVDACELKMRQLNNAVEQATSIAEDLIEETLPMEIALEIFSTADLQELNVKEENEALQKFYQLKCKEAIHIDVSDILTPFLELYDVHKHIFSLQKVCTSFNLKNCLADFVLNELTDIANQVIKQDMTAKETKVKVERIKQIFNINDSLMNHPCFCLFSCVQDSRELYTFAKERKYTGTNGMDTFIQEHRLVTTELLHDDEHEELMAVLMSAMQLIFPFLEESSSITELWDEINKVGNIDTATSYLRTVNKNVGAIKELFNQAIGETAENNENILKAIMCNGGYQYTFCKGHHVEMSLNFFTDSGIKTWSPEAVENFSQELSFMKIKEESMKSYMKWFKYHQPVATKLYEYYSELQYHGHPLYKNPNPKCFKLCIDRGELKIETQTCENELKKFTHQLIEHRKVFKLLSFINAQKLKGLYDNLIQQDPDIDEIIRDIGFLIKLNKNSHPVLQLCIESLQCKLVPDANVHPAEAIGQFLYEFIDYRFFIDYQLLNDSLIYPTAVSPRHSIPTGDPVTFSLISAFEYTNMDLIKLIYFIFGESFPMFHQLFRCSAQTTEEEIDLFFDRIHNFPQTKYLVMGINLIENELQQVFLERCSKLKHAITAGNIVCSTKLCIYLVEYSPSLFHHIPWISIDRIDQLPDFEEVVKACQAQKMSTGTYFKKFEVVYGLPGSGKTHYIRNCIKQHIKNHRNDGIIPHKTLSINETFNKSNVIRSLKKELPLMSFDILYHLNINLIWPQSKESKHTFFQLVNDINWFFFDYYILGYVEVLEYVRRGSKYTSLSCLSLPLPTDVSTSVYVEAPYWNVTQDEYQSFDLQKSWEKFKQTLPVFSLLGKVVTPPDEYDVNAHENMQLVFKYLKAKNDKKLDQVISSKNPNIPIEIGKMYADIPTEDCHEFMEEIMPSGNAGERSKIMETLFLKYMERRCRFMEEKSPFFRFNAGTRHPILDQNGKKTGEWSTRKMRSIVFEIMIEEVKNFCKSSISWSSETHRQLIYDEGRFMCICPNHEQLPKEQSDKLRSIGVQLPTQRERLSTQLFHNYLSTALNVKKDPNTGEISFITEKKFVLTTDFVQKILNIHERKECGMPVVIEGETGVGKTFLLELLSSLWNNSWKEQLMLQRQRIKDIFNEKLAALIEHSSNNTSLKEVQGKLERTETVSEDSLFQVLMYRDPKSGAHLYETLQQKFEINTFDPVLASLEMPPGAHYRSDFSELLKVMKRNCNAEYMAAFLYGVLYGSLKSTFYKLSIHSAMKPDEIRTFFRQVQVHADSLMTCYQDYVEYKYHQTGIRSGMYGKPIVTVFLDEINTSVCPGFLKEIIIDGTVDGKKISTSNNIFIVAACNPHRGHSLAPIASKFSENWFNPSYHVQNLPPTLKLLMWNYRQLQEADEVEYINEKFRLSYSGMNSNIRHFLSEQISKAQGLIRNFAQENLTRNGVQEEIAKLCSESTVSQRDIQRVFHLYSWLKNWFQKHFEKRFQKEFKERFPNDHNNEGKKEFFITIHALNVALALVYYFRLNDEYRNQFLKGMYVDRIIGEHGAPDNLQKSLDTEMKWVNDNMNIPRGIAPTDALKENIYAIMVCTMAKIPVIIVGPPGSSKTLSFKIVTSNLVGGKSTNENLRDLEIFKALDPHPYQCSHKSTSNEIDLVFQRAINRQRTSDESGIKSISVVLMDEAGLPDESLKVLHYFLDCPKVAFVGISNSVLDAAKTNRAISIYRTDTSHEDLIQLAKYSLYNGSLPAIISEDVRYVIERFVKIYEEMMRKHALKNFFGLRDFIHFFTYLGRNKQELLSPQSVLTALEQNFNGKPAYFNEILRAFLQVVGSQPSQLQQRSLIKILMSSFKHEPRDFSLENQVRYKLLIDSSEDQSLIRQLFAFGIFSREQTKIYSCSKLPGDGESQKLYTTSAIRYSTTKGHTLIIYQAEDIQECFYDLFNQRFTHAGGFFYTNVSIGPTIRTTRVSPYFNCAMIISKSEVEQTKKPFLNRFEKFSLSHEILYKEKLSTCSNYIKLMMNDIKNDVLSFVQTCEESSFYGFNDQTVDSLMLSIIPMSQDHCCCSNFIYNEEVHVEEECQCSSNKMVFIKSLLKKLQGIRIQVLGNCSEISHLINYVYSLINYDEFVHEILTVQSHEDVDKYAQKCVESFDKMNYKNVSAQTSVNKEEFPLIFLKELVTVYVYKQLLQLMTPEALVFRSKLIHSYYIHCYLTHQSHFTLAKIVCGFKSQKVKPFVKKFLCYTRTSPAVFVIPQHFTLDTQLSKDKLDELETLFNIEKNFLQTYIITSNTSQQKLNQVLEEFFNARAAVGKSKCDVLVLAADMNNLHKDTINHARLLIEEIEISYMFSGKLASNKLVFFVLHFPCNLFYSHCYPSLFMNGWQHLYMDMIGQVKSECFIDMEQWLSICLLQDKDQKEILRHASNFVKDTMMDDWLKEWLSMISKSIQFPATKDFSKDTGIHDTKCYWKKLLFTLESDKVIKRRFGSFWSQDAMTKLSQQAATYALTYKSTCTLTNTIKATVQSSFKDVVLYFLSKANQSMTINTVLRNEDICESSVSVKLFNDILAVLPIPKSLQEVKLQLTVLNQQKGTVNEKLMNAPQFPFFNIIFQLVEGILNKALSTTVVFVNIAKNKSIEQKEDIDLPNQDAKVDESELVTNEMVKILDQDEEEYKPIKVAIEVMRTQTEFWDFYCEDALSAHLSRPLGKFSRQHLKQCLLQIDSNNIPMKLSRLHYDLRMLLLKAKKLSLLHTLDECCTELEDDDTSSIESDIEKDTATHTDESAQNLEMQTDNVIQMLYSSLLNICNKELNVLDIRKLAYLFNQMMTLFTVSSTSMCGTVRNKWIVLCVVFHVEKLMTMSGGSPFKVTIKNFVINFVRILNTYVTSDTCIKLNYLAKITGSIAFSEENIVKFLKSNSCPMEMYSIIECISTFYINYLYDYITEEDASSIFQYIDAVLSTYSKSAESYKTNFKYIFSCLLGSSNISAEVQFNPLALFICEIRSVLGSLIASESNCTYMPVIFKCCPQLHDRNVLPSTKPLCDLYFEVIVRKLQAKENRLSELVLLHDKIENSYRLPGSNKALLAIEKQAVVYVVISLLAIKLLQNENERRTSFEEVYEQLNAIIDLDNVVVSKTKKEITGNGLLLLLNILITCKKKKVLLSMMTSQFDSLLCDFHCLRPISACIIREMNPIPSPIPLKSDSKFLEYLKKDHYDQYKIFNDIYGTVKKILDSHKIRGVNTLMDIARFCYSKDTKDPSLLTKWTFNMSLFLSVYYEVFLRQNINDRSKTMTEVLLEKMSQYVQPKYLNFILWLAKPSSSDPYGKNLTSYDKLKQFFVQDEKHRAHVHCIIQLAAVIFGNTEHSCHLYDHLFNPKDISTDFIPGSVILAGAGTCYSQVMNVSKNNSLYYTSRKSLTWHSLLFAQWMNYGMLCFSIITGPSKAKHLQFHHQQSLVTVCLNNLKSLWEILTTDCCLAFEDTALLASYGAQNVYKVLKSNRINNSWQCLSLRKSSTEGWKTVLSEIDQLDSLSRYEKILHNEVFRPSWDSMKSLEKFVSFGKTIGKHMRELTASVPELNIRSVDPLRAFLMTVLSSTNICNTSCPSYVLYQFILCRPSLNVAAELLPSLVDLYNWINTRLTHKVTSDIAKSNCVGVVLESILQQFFPQDEHKMQNAIELYLNYKKLISDDSISQLPALNLQMSFYDFVTTVDGKDNLFQLINLLVKQYNEFVQMFHQHFSSKHYFGEHVSSTKIPLTEVIQQTCAFGTSKSHHDLKDMEEIILKYCSMDVTTKNRSLCYDGDDKILSNCVPEVFSLTGIQNEVIQMFIFHKQFIDIENFRKKFAFSEVSLYEEVPRSLFYTATYGQEDTVKRLDKFTALKTPLDDELIYDFTSTFHSLSYDSLLSVCGGLCLILKMLLEKAEVAQEEILTLTVQSFLTKYYFSDSNGRVLNEVGIVIHDAEHIRSGLTVNQYNQLCSASVTVVASISELFHEWVKIGFYDFSHLPHSMKIPISQNDDRSESVQEWIEGNDDKIIKDVMHLLFKFEQLFCQAENHNTKKMSDILKDKTIINNTNADVIVSLPIQYYVHIQLRFRNKLLDNSRDVQEKQHNIDVENFINITPESVEQIDRELNRVPHSPPPVEYVTRPPSPVDYVKTNNTTTTIITTTDNESQLKLEADKMLSEDVAQFLDSKGFTESAQIVRENDDDGRSLYSVTLRHNSEELKLFNITKEIDKLRFCVLFRRELTIRAGLAIHIAAAKYGPKELAEFLSGVQRAKPFAKKCEEQGIDGEMLLQAENSFFRELDVPVFVQENIMKNFREIVQHLNT